MQNHVVCLAFVFRPCLLDISYAMMGLDHGTFYGGGEAFIGCAIVEEMTSDGYVASQENLPAIPIMFAGA